MWSGVEGNKGWTHIAIVKHDQTGVIYLPVCPWVMKTFFAFFVASSMFPQSNKNDSFVTLFFLPSGVTWKPCTRTLEETPAIDHTRDTCRPDEVMKGWEKEAISTKLTLCRTDPPTSNQGQMKARGPLPHLFCSITFTPSLNVCPLLSSWSIFWATADGSTYILLILPTRHEKYTLASLLYCLWCACLLCCHALLLAALHTLLTSQSR